MAQFFDFPVRVTPADDAIDVITARWCEAEPTVAISTRTRKLYFVQEEVCASFRFAAKHPCAVFVFQTHPLADHASAVLCCVRVALPEIPSLVHAMLVQLLGVQALISSLLAGMMVRSISHAFVSHEVFTLPLFALCRDKSLDL